MKKRTIRTICTGVLICAFAASAAVGAGQVARQTAANPAYKPPRTPEGQPDLQGIWQVRNTANWDVQSHGGAYRIPAGFGVVEGEEIPYQPWAVAKKQENFKNRLTEDPVEKCYMAGVPRTMYLPYPVQILQTPEAVVIVSPYVHTWRWIPTVAVPRYDGYEAWMGDPRGRWDGNTLVVESIGFNGQTSSTPSTKSSDRGGNSSFLIPNSQFSRSSPAGLIARSACHSADRRS